MAPKSKRSLHWFRSISIKISVQVLLQYQSKSYYIIGQEVYYSIGRFITLSGSYYSIGRLLHYRLVHPSKAPESGIIPVTFLV